MRKNYFSLPYRSSRTSPKQSEPNSLLVLQHNPTKTASTAPKKPISGTSATPLTPAQQSSRLPWTWSTLRLTRRIAPHWRRTPSEEACIVCVHHRLMIGFDLVCAPHASIMAAAGACSRVAPRVDLFGESLVRRLGTVHWVVVF